MSPAAASRTLRSPWDQEAIIIPAIAADGSHYPIEKMEAHRRGVHHLAVSVFVFSGDELLVQRRAAGKYHCAGVWANTCCSHPHWGEAPADSAHRRLQEELGLRLPLRHTAVIDYAAEVSDGLRECERVHIYRAEADRRALSIRPDPAEVSETRWAPLADLREDVGLRPAAYAPWFRIYIDRWAELSL